MNNNPVAMNNTMGLGPRDGRKPPSAHVWPYLQLLPMNLAYSLWGAAWIWTGATKVTLLKRYKQSQSQVAY